MWRPHLPGWQMQQKRRRLKLQAALGWVQAAISAEKMCWDFRLIQQLQIVSGGCIWRMTLMGQRLGQHLWEAQMMSFQGLHHSLASKLSLIKVLPLKAV